jgi:hypothetical protein
MFNPYTVERKPLPDRVQLRMPAIGTPVLVHWIRQSNCAENEKFDPPLAGEIVGAIGARVRRRPHLSRITQEAFATDASKEIEYVLLIRIANHPRPYTHMECGWTIAPYP